MHINEFRAKLAVGTKGLGALIKELPEEDRREAGQLLNPEAIFLTGLLGESGRRLVKAGIEFYFERDLAKKLIDKQIAMEIK